jgi:hypothetical protein
VLKGPHRRNHLRSIEAPDCSNCPSKNAAFLHLLLLFFLVIPAGVWLLRSLRTNDNLVKPLNRPKPNLINHIRVPINFIQPVKLDIETREA